jgi:uncharacterized protein (DUF1697 family)
MKTDHVALIRGINVGRAKRVAMADLRTAVERLGYTDVRTLLNSGNAVFSASSARLGGRAAPLIEAALQNEIGVPARVVVLDADELRRTVAENPLVGVATNESRLFAAVLLPDADRSRLESVTREDWGREALALGTHAAYLWCPDGALESPLNAAFTRAAKDSVTMRNWATMLKLHAMLADREGRRR